MRLPVTSAALLCFTLSVFSALGQPSRPADDGTQAHKEWELTASNRDLEKRDGALDNPAVLKYVQSLADRLSAAASVPILKVRVTRSDAEYASVSHAFLYLSAGLFIRTEDEAELAGIVAHELAHAASSDAACILDPFQSSDRPDNSRERENQATKLALSYLKAAGYDPTSLLSLLSTLAYGHPLRERAIRSDDLAELRSVLENEALPPHGYRLDSSDFIAIHSVFVRTAAKGNLTPALRVSR